MMRILQVSAIALAVLFGGTSQSDAFKLPFGGSGGGEGGGSPTNVQALFKNLMAGAKDVCAKGHLMSGKITIRSGNGAACKHKVIAALATMKCGKRSDFAGSHCGQNAERVLAGQAPKAVLQAEFKKGSKMAKAVLAKFFKKKAAPAPVADDEDIDVGGGDDGDGDDSNVDETEESEE